MPDNFLGLEKFDRLSYAIELFPMDFKPRRGDPIGKEFKKAIAKSEDSTVKIALTVLLCAYNQKRGYTVISSKKIAELCQLAGIGFDTRRYGKIFQLLEKTESAKVIFQEKFSKKPTVIQITKKELVDYFLAENVNFADQEKECLEFVNDLSRFSSKQEKLEETEFDFLSIDQKIKEGDLIAMRLKSIILDTRPSKNPKFPSNSQQAQKLWVRYQTKNDLSEQDLENINRMYKFSPIGSKVLRENVFSGKSDESLETLALIDKNSRHDSYYDQFPKADESIKKTYVGSKIDESIDIFAAFDEN